MSKNNGKNRWAFGTYRRVEKDSNIIMFPVKKKSGKIAELLAIAFILCVALFWLCDMVVSSREKMYQAELECYYDSLEQQLVADARAVLEREGFHNSGVMLTGQVDMDGTRSYKLTIHHGAIDDLSEERKDALSDEIAECYFVDNKCQIRQEFLVYD